MTVVDVEAEPAEPGPADAATRAPATDGRLVLATVSSEHATVLVDDEAGVCFGRGADAHLRIGAAPVHDDVVPRRAGRIFFVGDRPLVENLDERFAFDIRVDGRPLRSVAPGDVHGPHERNFDVVVTGAVSAYTLAIGVNVDRVRTVLLRAHATAGEDAPPTGAVPELTERQRRVIDAYVAPLATGGVAASHQHVSEQLGISRSLVRVECRKIWSALFLAGVPMRAFGDARDEIIDAWGRHRI